MNQTFTLKLLTFLLLFWFSSEAQPSFVSWNLCDLGSSKSDSTLVFIASQIKNFDIVALQEIVTNPSGAQAVAQLADLLNRSGAKWDYAISDPTQSSAYKTERYAFLWKTASVQLVGKPWLETKYALEIDREPFYATFKYQNKSFTIVNFHAITQSKQPETEIKYFKFLPDLYPTLHLIFVGDFNCPQSHTVFNPLKSMGYAPVFDNQKTTLKQKCTGTDCLANPFDNIFYNKKKQAIVQQGVIHFYKEFDSLESARKVSDHLPIWFTFQLL